MINLWQIARRRWCACLFFLFFSPTLQAVTSFFFSVLFFFNLFFLYGSSLIHISAGHSQNHLTSGFWIAGKSLIHGNLFSYTSQNPVARPLPLPHVVLESAPTTLHRMSPALKGSAVILFFLNLWHWNTLTFLSGGKVATSARWTSHSLSSA